VPWARGEEKDPGSLRFGRDDAKKRAGKEKDKKLIGDAFLRRQLCARTDAKPAFALLAVPLGTPFEQNRRGTLLSKGRRVYREA
jgi:hypothetical protein